MIEDLLKEEKDVCEKIFLTLKRIVYTDKYNRRDDKFVWYKKADTFEESFLYYDTYQNIVCLYTRTFPEHMCQINGFDWNDERIDNGEEGYSSGVDVTCEDNYSDELSMLISRIKECHFWSEFEEAYTNKYLSNTMLLMNNLDNKKIVRKLKIDFSYDQFGSQEDFDQTFTRLKEGVYIVGDKIPSVSDVCFMTPDIFKYSEFHKSLDDVLSEIDVEDLPLRYEWEIYNTRGYNQGDITTVIYQEGKISTDLINHIFWDMTIDAHITSEDGSIDEWISLGYLNNWEKDYIAKQIISNIGAELTEEEEEELKNLIPDEFPNDLY